MQNDLNNRNWRCFGKIRNSQEKTYALSFWQQLEVANLILILYNLHFISETAYIKKYRSFIEKYATFLEDLHEFKS